MAPALGPQWLFADAVSSACRGVEKESLGVGVSESGYGKS